MNPERNYSQILHEGFENTKNRILAKVRKQSKVDSPKPSLDERKGCLPIHVPKKVVDFFSKASNDIPKSKEGLKTRVVKAPEGTFIELDEHQPDQAAALIEQTWKTGRTMIGSYDNETGEFTMKELPPSSDEEFPTNKE